MWREVHAVRGVGGVGAFEGQLFCEVDAQSEQLHIWNELLVGKGVYTKWYRSRVVRAYEVGPHVNRLKHAKSMEWGTIGSVRGSKCGAILLIDKVSVQGRRYVWSNHLRGVYE